MSKGVLCTIFKPKFALSVLSNASASLRRLITVYCVAIALFIALSCLNAILTCSEIASAALFELCSNVLAVRPCGIYRPQESAIAVVGGEADMGRQIALHFSELGYTVFALCRTQAEETSSDVPGTRKASNVSSQLLYEWHFKRKRSQRSASWGLIAPIILETGSEAQREHAFETVHAYCTAHSLHLVATIISPSNAPLGQTTLMDILNWGDVAERSLKEPIHVAQGCVDMLSSSSGRMILVSGCKSPSQIEGAFSSVARCSEDVLVSLGIRLSSVIVGPSASTARGSHGFDESTLPIAARADLFKSICKYFAVRKPRGLIITIGKHETELFTRSLRTCCNIFL
ncbi:hypothetical protein B0H21DRAFT_715043 [Amylocystis lapponica]|nr:hypothetical protein B0H21DRAFT_715043 [Amylocystis lapponica]